MSKIHRHKCKSLKEFNKIFRKYIKYFRDNYIYHTYWNFWIWYDAIGMEALQDLQPYAEKLYAQNSPNFKHILQKIKDNYNWSFKHKNGYTYYLRGVEISNEDYYYIYINEEGDKIYNSCVGRFTDIL